MIKQIREQNKNILLLDSGDSFSSISSAPALEAEVITEGMNHIGYDGLNIADGELSVGLDLFAKIKEKASFPLLSANIFPDEQQGSPLGERYLIKKFADFTVGVVGVASPDVFDEKYFSRTSLVIKDPEEILREVLPELQAKTNVIVLLSHLGLTATEDLVGKFAGIDVAIVGHEPRPPGPSKFIGDTLVVQSFAKGTSIGALELRFDQDGLLIGHKSESKVIAESTPVDPAVQALVRKFTEEKASLRRAAREKQRRDELMRKNRKLLKMTPEEFITEMKKEEQLKTPEEIPETESSKETRTRFP